MKKKINEKPIIMISQDESDSAYLPKTVGFKQWEKIKNKRRRTWHYNELCTTKYLFADRLGRKEPGSVYKPYLFAKLKSIQE